MKIEIKHKHSGEVIFSHDCENNTTKKTVLKAIECSANLSSADLSSANLRYADLSYAKTDKKYCSISAIGSAKRMTTYCFEDDIIWCGCFRGTLKEFEAKVKVKHANNPQYKKEYLNFIKYLKSIAP